jgi:uncharacterized membrane protein YccC
MNAAILVAVIGAVATLIVAVVSHFFARRRDHQLKNLEFKLDRYADFLGAFAEMGSGQKTHEAHLRIANAINTMNLFASRDVLDHVYTLLDYVNTHKDITYSVVEQDKIISHIILSIRTDLGEETSSLANFPFRTISPGRRTQ